MKKIISNIILFLFIFNGFSQETHYIYLKNKKNNKEKYIKENKNVHILHKDSSELNGRFRILNDTTIIVENDTISINDIKLIKRKGVLLPGTILTILDSPVTLYGAICCYLAIAYQGTLLAFTAAIMGIPALIIGAIPTIVGIRFLILNKRYKTDKWKIKIITEKEK